MPHRLTVTLHGDQAAPGEVRAADIARVIFGVERAMAKGCGHVLGRRVKATGRWGVLIEEAVDLRFVSYGTGSLIHVFDIPTPTSPPDSLQLEGSSLGELGAQVAISALGKSAIDYPDVAEVWVQLAQDVGIGSRHDSLELVHEMGTSRREAVLDTERRYALEGALRDLPIFELRSDLLIGVLVEADFESLTARLRTATGDRIAVEFDPSLSDDIQLALRHSTSLVGEIRFNTETATAVSVHVRSVTAPIQLALDLTGPAFAGHQSIAELVAERGPRRLRSADDLPYLDIPELDLTEALEALET